MILFFKGERATKKSNLSGGGGYSSRGSLRKMFVRGAALKGQEEF